MTQGKITPEQLERVRSRIGVEWVDREPYFNGVPWSLIRLGVLTD